MHLRSAAGGRTPCVSCSGDVAAGEALVQQCEHVISIRSEGWMSKGTSPDSEDPHARVDATARLVRDFRSGPASPRAMTAHEPAANAPEIGGPGERRHPGSDTPPDLAPPSG